MGKIKYIVFDVGGVLISKKIDAVHNKLNKIMGKKIFSRNALHMKLLTGKMSSKDYYSVLSKKNGISAEKLIKTQERFYKNIMKLNRRAFEIARKAKNNGYKIAVISNVTPEHKKININRGVYKSFHPVILSCDIGNRKPEKKIFVTFLKRAKIKPDECIYIDDRKEYLCTPKNMGFKTLQFRNPSRLISDLKSLGVSI